MPFKITHGKQGYFVYDPATKKHFSKKALTKQTAYKQRVAIALSESKKKGENPSKYFV